MKKALVSLVMVGLAGCASSVANKPPVQPLAAAMILPQHQMADLSAAQNGVDVPLKPMTASQSAARMN